MNDREIERSLQNRLSAPIGFWAELFDAHRTPGRHYHTLAHVADVASQYDRVGQDIGWRRPTDVLLAVLFHDAVYRVGAKDNERASAELAAACVQRHLARADVEQTRVSRLIESTAEHSRLTPADVDAESALFLDCDMAILGAQPEAYQKYARAVRAEWSPVVSAAAYRAGRRDFLQRVLSAPRIFLSAYFHDRLDELARINLRTELDHLTGIEPETASQS